MSTNIKNARDFAILKHENQMYGENNYVFHLDQVYQLICEAGLDENHKIAAYLHDVLEDTPTTILEIENKFSKNVAQMVFSVSGFGQNRKERNQNIKEKLLLNPQHIDLKLADRIANMRNSKEKNPKLYKMYMNELSTFQELAKNGCHYFRNILQNEFLNQAVIKKNKIN